MRRNRGRALVALAVACGLVAGIGGATAVGKSKFDANNARRVNGIAAAKKPVKNKLVPLDRTGQFPASTINPTAGKGRTYRGVFVVEDTAPAGTDPATAPFFIGGGISLPFSKKPLTPGDAGVIGGGLEPPDCDGDFNHPSAPPGRLCIYPGTPAGGDVDNDEADVLNVLKNGEGAWEATPFVIAGGNFGVRVSVQAAGPGRVKFSATWAYTAP
jgi:hypothetical protein